MAEMETMYDHRAMDDGRYTFKGTGNAGLATGIIGTALGVLNGGLGLFNGMGGCMTNHASNYVSKEAFDLQKKISEQESTISLLRSEANTEVKIADVYARLKGDILDLERSQNAKWTDQSVINAQVAANLSVMQNQISVLNGLTKTIIPIGNVCPEPMPAKNSWTAPTA